jgi:hypothetical protein
MLKGVYNHKAHEGHREQFTLDGVNNFGKLCVLGAFVVK